MKKLLILLAIFTTVAATAQSVGINTDGSSANASAILDLKSTTQGFLPPRMTYVERQTITSPAIGLMIYCTNCGPGTGEPQFYNGTAWVNMIGGTALTQPPTVAATTAASSITKTTATAGGNVTFDYGNAITARGICWSTAQNPTTADSKTTEAGTTGIFSSNITGLTPGNTYYVRAYATNAMGTSYGTQVSFKSADYTIGESALGGKIAYLLQSGDSGYDPATTHGLVATNADISSVTSKWGGTSNLCYMTNIAGADGTAIGTGLQNTVDIINYPCYGDDIAARRCGDLVQGGYSDWYLPSKDEMYKLYLNRASIVGFSSNAYWTSSEYSATHAWYQDVSDGTQVTIGKTNVIYIRPVRSF
jgi:hypothetical protein